MAKRMSNSLKEINSNTFNQNVEMIHFSKLIPSTENYFIMNDIELFADTILNQGGIRDNLVVSKNNDDTYEIISGHRRYAAIKYLIENNKANFNYLPCLIKEYNSNDEKMLDLILLNTTTRQLSDAELYQSYLKLSDILSKDKYKRGYGTLRSRIAEQLHISETQVQKIKNVVDKAVPEVKNRLLSGDISLNVADGISSLESHQQNDIITKDRITNKDVLQAKNSINILEIKPNKELINFANSNKDKLIQMLDKYAEHTEYMEAECIKTALLLKQIIEKL